MGVSIFNCPNPQPSRNPLFYKILVDSEMISLGHLAQKHFRLGTKREEGKSRNYVVIRDSCFDKGFSPNFDSGLAC